MNFFNGDEYEGYFLKGIKEGTGTYSDSDGNYYTGNFKNDDKHGLGTLKYYNGDTYIGDWNDGEKSGKGTFTWLDAYWISFLSSHEITFHYKLII